MGWLCAKKFLTLKKQVAALSNPEYKNATDFYPEEAGFIECSNTGKYLKCFNIHNNRAIIILDAIDHSSILHAKDHKGLVYRLWKK